MKDQIQEQTDNSVSKIGKFNTPDELLSAYNALQSEFTKRCQLIKQLQAELDALSAQAQQTSVAIARDAQQAPDDADTTVDQTEADEPRIEAIGAECAESQISGAPITASEVLDEIAKNIAEYAEVLSAFPEVEEAAVARYKRKLLVLKSVGAAPCGIAVITPAKKPRTLADAKAIADRILLG